MAKKSVSRGRNGRNRSYSRADVARQLAVTETEVEAMTLLASEFLSPNAREQAADPDERRREIGRLIGQDALRLQREQTELLALINAYEERCGRVESFNRSALEETEGKSFAAKADVFRERVTRWEHAARELCRAYGIKPPDAAAGPDI